MLCGGFFLWHSPGRWAKFRQGLAFSSFSKFPKPWGRNSSVPTRGQKVVMKSMKFLQKMYIDSAAIFGWFLCMIFSSSCWSFARICKIHKIPCKYNTKIREHQILYQPLQWRQRPEEFMDTWTSLFSDVDSSTEPQLGWELVRRWVSCIPAYYAYNLYTYTVILMYTVFTLCKQSIALYYVCNLRRNIHI